MTLRLLKSRCPECNAGPDEVDFGYSGMRRDEQGYPTAARWDRCINGHDFNVRPYCSTVNGRHDDEGEVYEHLVARELEKATERVNDLQFLRDELEGF